MRKIIINRNADQEENASAGADWLDLERLARAELTSEDGAYPIEAAVGGMPAGGWRASGPGEQVVRLLFDEPLGLRRIHLQFRETDQVRTQEFVVRWSRDGGRTWQEVVRQQFNFSPPTTTDETEDYRVALDGVRALEIRILPDIGEGQARASLARLRLA